MNNASVAVLAKLREELRIIAARTLSLTSAAGFRRVCEGGGDLFAQLAPTEVQRAEAEALGARLRRWSGVTASLIRRYAIAIPVPLELLVQRAEIYVLLRRRTAPNVTEGGWRRALEEEWARACLALDQVLDRCDEQVPTSMRRSRHVRIDVRIEDVGDTSCRVCIGPTAVTVPLPFTHAELADFVESCRRPRAVAAIQQAGPLEQFGRKLFSIITHDALADVVGRAVAEAGENDARVWMSLRLRNAGVLAQAPWELLHDGDAFLAVQRSTAITRTLGRAGVPRVPRDGPARVLVTISAPRDQTALNVARERQLLQDAAGGLELLGLLQLDFAPDGTLDTLRRMLRRADELGRPYNAWHFTGHGSADARGRAELLMTDPRGLSHPVGGYELQALFGAHPTLDFAVLNACQSGRGGIEATSTGIASTLMDCGIAVVVAMQFEISDGAALVLCEELYGAIATGEDILAAMTEARRAIFCRSEGVEWMTPIVFLRADQDTNSS